MAWTKLVLCKVERDREREREVGEMLQYLKQVMFVYHHMPLSPKLISLAKII